MHGGNVYFLVYVLLHAMDFDVCVKVEKKNEKKKNKKCCKKNKCCKKKSVAKKNK